MFQITSEIAEGYLLFYLNGKLDTNTYIDADNYINEKCDCAEYKGVIVDCENLQYISSSGIRTILKLKKRIDNTIIINTQSEIYEILQITGLSEIMTVKKAFRQLSVDGCKVLGEGAKGIVYRYNEDTIVKVYKDVDIIDSIQRERDLARRAFILGVPTAISYDIVKVGDKYGSVFELLDTKTISELISENLDDFDKYVEITANLLKLIHSINVNEEDMPDAKIVVNKWVEACAPYFSFEQNEKIRKLVDNTPNDLSLLHFDYHTNNIMIQNDEPLLIDMDTLCHGNPIFELANVYITFVGFGFVDKTIVENFVHIPYEVSCDFWAKLLPIYLGDKSVKKEEIEKKIKLLANMRLIRHVSRRGINSDNDKKLVDYCIEQINELLPEIDSLAL